MVRISPLCILLLVCGLLLSHSAGGCNNPLFDKSQWPSAYTRPSYLTEPTIWKQEDPPLCPEVDSTSSCCSAETASGIMGNYMEFIGNWYEEWVSLDGIIQDTFNDFNPVIQQQKIDYGWTENWSGVSSQGSEGGSSSSSTTSADAGTSISSDMATSYTPEKPDQAVIDAAFSSDPAEGVPDSYASIELKDGDYVWYDFWPYGRGKSRSRTGILKLSNSTQTELRHKANDMNGYMMQFSFYNYECQSAFKKHMVGMLCMGCDPNWADWVTSSASTINVLINSDSCSALYDSCKHFLQLYQDIPDLVSAMVTAVKSAVTADPSYAQVSSSIYLSDLDSMINKKSVTLCDGKTACKKLLCTSFAAGTSGIFPDRKLIADPAGLATGKVGRSLVSTVTFELDSDGYDAMAAGAGESTIVIPVMYATAEGTDAPGAASDTSTGTRVAPFGDSLDSAAQLWVGVAAFGILVTY